MDYSNLLTIGESFTAEYVVKKDDTADTVGNKGVMVLSTPALLKYIENGSSSGELKRRLPKGYSPVGIRVTLNHIGAVPVNGKIEIQSEVVKTGRNKIKYEFKAFYKENLIADGTYEQAIINLENFLEKNKAL